VQVRVDEQVGMSEWLQTPKRGHQVMLHQRVVLLLDLDHFLNLITAKAAIMDLNTRKVGSVMQDSVQ
jgi:hypothetical protein